MDQDSVILRRNIRPAAGLGASVGDYQQLIHNSVVCLGSFNLITSTPQIFTNLCCGTYKINNAFANVKFTLPL